MLGHVIVLSLQAMGGSVTTVCWVMSLSSVCRQWVEVLQKYVGSCHCPQFAGNGWKHCPQFAGNGWKCDNSMLGHVIVLSLQAMGGSVTKVCWVMSSLSSV